MQPRIIMLRIHFVWCLARVTDISYIDARSACTVFSAVVAQGTEAASAAEARVSLVWCFVRITAISCIAARSACTIFAAAVAQGTEAASSADAKVSLAAVIVRAAFAAVALIPGSGVERERASKACKH